jgi:hypothetical protein
MEQIHAIRSIKSNYGYSNLKLNKETITNIMDIIKTGRKGKHLNTLEKY